MNQKPILNELRTRQNPPSKGDGTEIDPVPLGKMNGNTSNP